MEVRQGWQARAGSVFRLREGAPAAPGPRTAVARLARSTRGALPLDMCFGENPPTRRTPSAGRQERSMDPSIRASIVPPQLWNQGLGPVRYLRMRSACELAPLLRNTRLRWDRTVSPAIPRRSAASSMLALPITAAATSASRPVRPHCAARDTADTLAGAKSATSRQGVGPIHPGCVRGRVHPTQVRRRSPIVILRTRCAARSCVGGGGAPVSSAFPYRGRCFAKGLRDVQALGMPAEQQLAGRTVHRHDFTVAIEQDRPEPGSVEQGRPRSPCCGIDCHGGDRSIAPTIGRSWPPLATRGGE